MNLILRQLYGQGMHIMGGDGRELALRLDAICFFFLRTVWCALLFWFIGFESCGVLFLQATLILFLYRWRVYCTLFEVGLFVCCWCHVWLAICKHWFTCIIPKYTFFLDSIVMIKLLNYLVFMVDCQYFLLVFSCCYCLFVSQLRISLNLQTFY